MKYFTILLFLYFSSKMSVYRPFDSDNCMKKCKLSKVATLSDFFLSAHTLKLNLVRIFKKIFLWFKTTTIAGAE